MILWWIVIDFQVNKKIDLVYGGGSIGLMGLVSKTVHDGGCNVLGYCTCLTTIYTLFSSHWASIAISFISPFLSFLSRIIPKALLPHEVCCFIIFIHIISCINSSLSYWNNTNLLSAVVLLQNSNICLSLKEPM